MKRIKQHSNSAIGYAAGYHTATLVENQINIWAIENKVIPKVDLYIKFGNNLQWYYGYNAGLDAAIGAIKHKNEEN